MCQKWCVLGSWCQSHEHKRELQAWVNKVLPTLRTSADFISCSARKYLASPLDGRTCTERRSCRTAACASDRASAALATITCPV